MNTITRPFNLEFTEDELETIAEALGEYILHDDPEIDPDDLIGGIPVACLLYTSPSPRDRTRSRMPSSA